ncbi:SRR1-domain-containing protein [Calocera cornea HHB12733]|uniref:SRR1-domain-containing protein n=1 Tax=Calocera cornea HHB12733 TaxID=1353952 RepID=A0A165HUD7_9BASI|nr:SRR1-domain-containing protein [Calocera cornea HHB12733]
MPPLPKPLSERMTRVEHDLAACEWFKSFTDVLSSFQERCPLKPKKIICLGLGSPSEWAPARFQLALLLEVCHAFDLSSKEVEAYDPVFTEEDKEYLRGLGVLVAEDQEARYELHEPTLVYMPHCDLPFYNNLFEVNWNLKRLENMILLGNDLEDYVVSGPTKRVRAKGPLVMKIVPYLAATALPDKFSLEDAAFNDLQLQFVKVSELPEEDNDFWELSRETTADGAAS